MSKHSYDTGLIKFRGNVGEVIQEARRSRLWSQEKLSEVTGLSQSQISRIEAGERSVSLYTIAQIAKILRIKPEEILEMN